MWWDSKTMREFAALAVIASGCWARGVQADTNHTTWDAAYAQARALVSNMTLLEMNNLTYGMTAAFSNAPCSGTSGGIPRLGYPGMCFQDAGNGVRGQDGVSSFASGVSVGASWNKELAHARGLYMGREFRGKGVNVALGPVVGPLGRIAEGGRNWEGFGADPYLDGQLVIPTIKAMQQSVIACVKHYIGNEQESNRTKSMTHAGGEGSSSNIGDETLHEVYAWPFGDAIHAGVGAVMCSYNRLNGTYACEDDHTLNQVLKQEMGFRGFVLSDWQAQWSGLPSAQAGLDVAMPNSAYWQDGALADLVSNGSLSRTRLEDMATRILAPWFKMQQDAAPSYTADLGFGEFGNLSLPHNFVNVRDPASAPTILKGAIEGHVLVKNVNKALPLRKPKVLSIFGNDAFPAPVNGPLSYSIGPISIDTAGLGWAQLGEEILPAYIYKTYQPNVVNGTLYTGGGSGSNNAPYISTPFDAIQHRAIEDGTALYWNYNTLQPQYQAASDACLVFLNAYASEGWDRPSLSDADGDELVMNVAGECSNTMVFIHNAGIRLVDAWIDHPNITAVMYAHLPGQDAGRALAKIIYGDVSPSGRLPYTVAKTESDYGNLLGPCPGPSEDLNPQCNYTEGVEIDYRSFLARNVTPRYEFGYGLTYTTFSYADLTIDINSAQATKKSTGLFHTVGLVTIQLRNTGSHSAAEVPQLYLQLPGARTKMLRGFEKTYLKPNGTACVEFELRRKDLSSWNSAKQQWVQLKGTYQVTVGAGVLDTKLSGSFRL